jgi:hypothetical protein
MEHNFSSIPDSREKNANMEQDKTQLLKQITLYGAAVIFILAGCFLIVFAPTGREQSTLIIAVALLTLAVGLAGFSYFRVRAPFIRAEAGTAIGKNARQANKAAAETKSTSSRSQRGDTE